MNSILEIKDLVKKYGDKKVVDNISFSMNEGEIIGLLGPNGAGKSTTISIITTITPKDGGHVLYHGNQITNQSKEFKSALGVVPQDLAIYDDLSAYENVRFFCSLYNIKGEELKKRTREALEFVGLWDRRKDSPRKFSGGMKRRLNIACSIAHDPKILIMDEPTVGIDAQSRNLIMEKVKVLNRRGTTIIYVSHYMEEIETICNRIVIMDHGKIMENLNKEEIKLKYKSQGCNNLEDIFLNITGTDLRDAKE